MRILHRYGIPFFDNLFGPSCCKDYFIEKVLCIGNFGPNVNETVRPRWTFSGQSGPL